LKNKKKNLEEKTVSYKPSSGGNTSRAKLKRKNNTFPSFPLGGKALPHRAKKKKNILSKGREGKIMPTQADFQTVKNHTKFDKSAKRFKLKLRLIEPTLIIESLLGKKNIQDG